MFIHDRMSTKEVLITIPQGTLRGSEETSELGDVYYSFQQIPYAKPPVGPLRFKAPEPAEEWKGIRDATKKGATCPHLDFFKEVYRDGCDEDSLFAAVYTRKLPQDLGNRKLPVLFNLHGSGFTAASGDKDMCGPDYFMAEDVVLVSFNYRLGALGYLSLQTPEYPGNYGLKDQRLALRWTKENISHFGGDPDNITIFGVSAGGASVHYQVLSPSTKGLFKRAIAQSGSALNPWAYLTDPRKCAFLLGKRLGCDTTDDQVLMDFLCKADPKDICLKSPRILDEIRGVNPGEESLSFAFVPTAEPEGTVDPIITKDPWTLVRNGEYQDVPFISGVCDREMGMAVMSPRDYLKWDKDEDFQAFIPRTLKVEKDTKLSLEVAKRIRNHYCKDGITLDNAIDILSANMFDYGVYKMAKSHLENKKSPNYLYLFTYDGSRSFFKALAGFKELEVKGAFHGNDIPYQFVSHMVLQSPLPPMQKGSQDHIVSKKFVKLWVNFAKNGNPSIDGTEVAWQPSDAKTLKHLVIGSDLELKEGFLKNNMDFWDEIYDLVEKNEDI